MANGIFSLECADRSSKTFVYSRRQLEHYVLPGRFAPRTSSECDALHGIFTHVALCKRGAQAELGRRLPG